MMMMMLMDGFKTYFLLCPQILKLSQTQNGSVISEPFHVSHWARSLPVTTNAKLVCVDLEDLMC